MAVTSGGYKTDFKLNIIATLSFYFFGKRLASKHHQLKVLAAIVNLVGFSLFDCRDSNKPEKINISLLSGC